MVRLAIDFSRSGPMYEWYLTNHAFWMLLQWLDEDVPRIGASMEEVESWHLQRTVDNSANDLMAADRLGMTARTLYNKRQKGIIA